MKTLVRAVVIIFALLMIVQSAPKSKKTFIDTSLYDGFVEDDFPFINSALDLGKSPVGFPQENFTPRGIFLKLDKGVWACFDRDLLRVSAIWTGGDFELKTMAQISYPGSGSKSNSFPKISGALQFANGIYPGISLGKTFIDPRKKPLGEMPKGKGKWLGLQLLGKETVLRYKIADIVVSETITQPARNVFSRRFSFSEISKPIRIVLFQKKKISSIKQARGVYEIQDGDKTITLTAKGGSVELSKDGKVIFTALDKSCEVRFSQDRKALVSSLAIKPQLLTAKYSTKRWKGSVKTRVVLGKSNDAYVIDNIEIPTKNPWRRSVRFAALDFFKNGRAAAVTFDGDVWLIDGLNSKSNSVTWKRFASGIYSPLSLKIHKDKIFVFGRDQITRLHDLNKDDEADYYENYSTAFIQAMNTRDFAMDMVIDKKGDIYLAKGGIQNMGGKLANKSFYDSSHAGTVVRIFNDGKSAEVFADGFREPFLGYDPVKNKLYATDQQGHYIPATPILEVNKGGFYGHAPSNYSKSSKTTEPVSWIPHRVDNSAAGMTFMSSNQMGPLKEKMLLHSYGKMGSFIVHRGDGYSGVSEIPGLATFPLLKGAVSQVDGQLYVTGFKIYGCTSKFLSGMGRLRYTGKKVSFPIEFKVFQEGLEITFDENLSSKDLLNLGNYQAQRWNYKRTSSYGSGHYKMDESAGEESLAITRIIANEKSNKVFLLIPGMKEVDQMALTYNLPSKKNAVYFSVSKLVKLSQSHFATKGIADLDLSTAVLKSKANLKKSPALGKSLLGKYACIGCHSLDGSKLGKIGPSFKGLYGSKRSFNKAVDQSADHAYLRESLLEPNKKIVKGFQLAMGSYKGILNEVEIDSIILYLQTIK